MSGGGAPRAGLLRPGQASYGPGLRRMARRAGPEALEALRQDTLAAQARARNDASATRSEVARTDREWYRDYPVPRGTKRRREAP